MKKLLLLYILVVFLFSSCKTPKPTVTGNFTYTQECIGAPGDGSEIIQIWVNGDDFKSSFDQACKDVLKEIIFKGIKQGKQDCDKRPLLLGNNPRDKYADYFNQFFSENGKWAEFAAVEDKKAHEQMKARRGSTFGIKVKVERAKLKKLLEKDGLIIKNNKDEN